MSIIIETFLNCDRCGKTFGVDNRHRTGQAHRKDAALEGWVLSGSEDHCPECRNRTKSGELYKRKNRRTPRKPFEL